MSCLVILRQTALGKLKRGIAVLLILSVALPGITVFEKPKTELKLNFKFSPIFWYSIIFFSISGLFVVGFLGEINIKIPVPDWMGEIEKNVNATIEFMISGGGNGGFFLSVILLSVLPAIGEELFFRGILQKLFDRITKNQLTSILITATIFSAYHFQFQTFLPRFFMGIMLGYLLVWSGSILVPMLAHFLHNFISIMVVKYNLNNGIEIENPETDYFVLLVSVLVLSGLSYWYYNSYKKNLQKPV
jgi:membrane protease YdiL (CAAX protease family)